MENVVIILLVALIIAVAFLAFMFMRKPNKHQLSDDQSSTIIALQKELENAKNNLEEAKKQKETDEAKIKNEENERYEKLKEEHKEAIEKLKKEHKNEIETLKEERNTAISNAKTEQKEQDDRLLKEQDDRHKEAIESQRKLFQTTIEKMEESIEITTKEIIDKRGEEFAQKSEESIAKILDPVQKDLTDMRNAVKDNKEKTIELTSSLMANIQNLTNQTQITAQSADELTKVLKGDNKIQGDWGERKLLDLLKLYGFRDGEEILTQEYIKGKYGNLVKDDDKKAKRPDVILRLDDKHVIVIDSKMSLKAIMDYTKALEEDDNDGMEAASIANMNSITNQIDLLKKTNYSTYISKQNQWQACDYTIMYVPVSGALQLAMAKDSKLWYNTMANDHILLCDDRSLITIIFILKIIWSKFDQFNNQQLIVEKAEHILDQIYLLAEHFVDAEKAINEAHHKIGLCHNYLTSESKTSVIKTATEIQELGVSPTRTQANEKRLPKISSLLEEAGQTDYEILAAPETEQDTIDATSTEITEE